MYFRGDYLFQQVNNIVNEETQIYLIQNGARQVYYLFGYLDGVTTKIPQWWAA
jgi:hypothetical protein